MPRLSTLAGWLGVGLLAAGACVVLTLDRRAAADVALALVRVGIVAVASWRFPRTGRWGTVGLATAGWSSRGCPA